MAANDDPFGWLMEECRLSPSEEYAFQHCSYFGVDSDSDCDSGCRNQPDIPVDSIAMVSPPESLQDELPNDQCNVPEGGKIFNAPRSTPTSDDDPMIADGLDQDTEILSLDEDSGRVVDLGRDTDLGFSEVDSTQKIEADSNQDDTFPLESEEDTASKRQLSTESLSEGLKSLEFESPTVRLGSQEKTSKNTPEPELQNQQSHESKPRVCEGSVDEEMEATGLEENWKFNLFDVLRLLGEKDSEEDRELCCPSLLEVAERRWGKF